MMLSGRARCKEVHQDGSLVGGVNGGGPDERVPACLTVVATSPSKVPASMVSLSKSLTKKTEPVAASADIPYGLEEVPSGLSAQFDDAWGHRYRPRRAIRYRLWRAIQYRLRRAIRGRHWRAIRSNTAFGGQYGTALGGQYNAAFGGLSQ